MATPSTEPEATLTRTTISVSANELKRIDIAASIETRGNRSDFMVRSALAAADDVLAREGIKVA